jgi:hypothetical protein
MVGNSTIRRCLLVALLLGVIAALSYGRSAEGDVKPKGAGKGVVQVVPDFPISLPAGAMVPDVVVSPAVPPDVFVGRVMALTRTLQCPRCTGTGTKVTRHRDLTVARAVPTMRETREDCGACQGTGFSLSTARVSPVLNSFIPLLGSTDPDAPATAKLLDKARTALERLGCSGELVERVTATTRNGIKSGRSPQQGAPCSVTGELGQPIPIGGGTRLIPVKVSAHSMVFLRAPIVNAAPSGGMVLVGGIVAGAITKVEWQWGQAIVLDAGYIVALVVPEHKGPGVDADKDGVIDRPPAPTKPKRVGCGTPQLRTLRSRNPDVAHTHRSATRPTDLRL